MSLANLEDAIEVMNVSSRSMPFAYDLDGVRFLGLSRFWNYSYKHSYVGYVRGEAAGVLLNSVQPATREAYSFYWGVVPEFRKGRISMALVYRYLDQVRKEGYLRAYADAGTRDSLRIYEKLGYRADEVLVQLESGEPRLPEVTSGSTIVPLELDRLIAERGPFMEGPYMWIRQPHFLKHNNNLLELLGAYRDGRLEAYAVLTTWPGNTLVLDFRTTESTEPAGLDLLRHLVVGGYPPPFVFTMVPRPSPMQVLLEAADFAETKESVSMTLLLNQ